MSREVFVFIPTFNCEKFISKTVESVLAQTYTDWEVLILDDCSSDNTFEIALQYSKHDSRIRALRNEKNIGMVNNWNKGVSFCQSKYFVKLDGDDKWNKEMLSKSLQVLEMNSEVGLVFTSYENIDINDAIIKDSRPVLPDFARNKSFSCIPLVREGSSKMLSYSILRQGLAVMRSEIFNEIGNYHFLLTESTQASSDTEFYFRLGCHHKIHCIDEVLYYYRIHERSISTQDKNDGLQQQKIFEVKTAIINYYLQQKKIDRKFWKRNKREIDFRYCLFKNYIARQNRKFPLIMLHSLKLLLFYPLKTWRHIVNRSQNQTN